MVNVSVDSVAPDQHAHYFVFDRQAIVELIKTSGYGAIDIH